MVDGACLVRYGNRRRTFLDLVLAVDNGRRPVLT